MESLIKHPVVFEFNGLPGTGKTTIQKELGKLLKADNIEYCTLYYKQKLYQRAVSLLLSPWLLGLFFKLKSYTKSFPKKQNRNWHIAGILSFVRSYRDFPLQSGIKVLIQDQGVVQNFVSIAHHDQIQPVEALNDAIDWIVRRKATFVRIECELDAELSMQRIQSRATSGSRLDAMDIHERRQILLTQQENFRIVREAFDKVCAFPVIRISTKLAPEENAQIIYQQMKQYL